MYNKIMCNLNKCQCQPKIKKIYKWVDKNKDLINKYNFLKLIINIKKDNIRGEINIYPNNTL